MFLLVGAVLLDLGDEGVFAGPARAHRREHAVERRVAAMLVVKVDGRDEVEPTAAVPREHLVRLCSG